MQVVGLETHGLASAPVPDSRDEPGRVRNGSVALGVAVGATACLLASAQKAPLPALGLAAAFLFLAIESDVRERRIPNWLTFPALFGFIGLAAWQSGLAGAIDALQAAGIALAVLVLPYAVGWLGAGDVKALMALAALWGASVFAQVFSWSMLCSGVFGIAWLLVRGGLVDMLLRWGRTLAVSLATRRWVYFAPAPGSAAAAGIPFGVAIALGVAAYQLWGPLWT